MEKLKEALKLITEWREEHQADLWDEDIDMNTQSCIDSLIFLTTENK